MEKVDGLIAQLFTHALDLPPKLEHIYAEHLLHQTENGNKYLGSLQQYTRQFINEDNQNSVVQFSHSNLQKLLQEKVNRWDDTDITPTTQQDSTQASNAANSLFSWSSGDSYIAARKRELQRKIESPEKPRPVEIRRPRASIAQKLNRVVERESNRFIQDRIELIKAHHSKQASRKVDERKRRDHEMHLHRINRKEEEYEKALQAAIASQNMSRQSGFFGSLFGFAHKNNSSYIMDIGDSGEFLGSPSIAGSSRNSLDVPVKSKRFSLLPPGLFKPRSVKSTTSDTEETPEDGAVSETPEEREEEANETSLTNGANVTNETIEESLPHIDKAHEKVEPTLVGLDEMLASTKGSPEVHDPFGGLDDLLSSPSPEPIIKHSFLSLEPADIQPQNDDLLML